MNTDKRRLGRPKADPKGRVQCYLSLDSVKKLDEMAEYIGRGNSKSDYFRMVLENHVRDMLPVLEAVKRGLLIPYYNKKKDRMKYIRKEDYERGLSLGRQVVDI